MSSGPSRPPQRVERYIDAVIRWRWAVLLGTLLAAVLVGTGARHLGLATNYRVFFGDDNPELLAFEAFENIYSKSDNILIVVHPLAGDVFNPRTLAAVSELTERAWQIPYSTRVDSITNFQHTWASGDDLVVEDLLPPERVGDAAIARVREVSLREPRLRGRIIAPDGRTTAVNVRIQAPDSELAAVVAPVRALQDEFRERFPDHKFALTGTVMMNSTLAEAPLEDAPVVAPLMTGVFVVLLVLFLRSAGAAAATLSLAALATLLAVGATGYAGVLLDPASVSAPIIILTLGIADSIHILMTFLGRQRLGDSRRDSLVEAYRVNVQPVFLTSTTTAVAFLSLNYSDSPPIHILGNVTAIGVMVAWVYSMTFLPALLAIVPLRSPSTSSQVAGLAARIADLVCARPRTLLFGLGSVVLALVASIGTLRINEKFFEYFDESVVFRQDTDFTIANLTGVDGQSYSIESGAAQGIHDPDFLRAVDAFADWTRANPNVMHVNSFTDTMKRLNQNMHADDPAWYRLPNERELAAQYLLLFEMSLPYGLDVNDQIDIEKSSLRLDVTYRGTDSASAMSDARESVSWFRDRGLDAVENVEVAGIGIMFGNIARRNVQGMLSGTGLGFGLIATILVVALRSFRVGLVSLIPNALPAAMAFGIWALVVGEVGFAVSIVAALSIGIIVDDTVHFLSKYQRARRELGHGAEQAVRYAFAVTVPAIIATSVILAAGFAMLGLGSFRVTSYMGLMTSLAIACALVTDLFLLPPLLILLDRRKIASPLEER